MDYVQFTLNAYVLGMSLLAGAGLLFILYDVWRHHDGITAREYVVDIVEGIIFAVVVFVAVVAVAIFIGSILLLLSEGVMSLV